MRLRLVKTFFCLITVSLLLISCEMQIGEVYQLPDNLEKILEPWEGDIYFLEHELPKLHTNIYHSISQDEYFEKIEKLKKECKNADDETRWVKIRSFVSSINDAHTAYGYSMKEAYPLNLVVLDEGVFVTAALNENRQLVRTTTSNPSAARVELIKIEGIPIFSTSNTESVFSIFQSILSHENESHLKSLMTSSLLDPSLLYGAGITTSKSKCNMTFRFPDNSEETILFEAKNLNNFRNLDWVVYYDDSYPADKTNLPPYIRNNIDTYYGEYYDDENTLYILYNACKDDPTQPFSQFVEEQYSSFKEETIDNVIVDLRNNSGGDSRVIKPLYSLLKKELSQSKLYVIIGASTFSSGLMNAIELSKKYDGILIGSPTGGKPNHYGEVKVTELPSGNRISWSTNYFTMIPGDDSDALYPDIPVYVTSEDFFELEDPVLETIFQQD